MAKSLNLFARRRVTLQLATLLATLLTLGFFATYTPVLLNNVYHTGWTLFGLFAFLALYNVRKKLPYPALFKSSSWLQLHIYAGTLGAIIFLIHTGTRFPTGTFDNLLYWNVFILLLTGFIGLWLTRTLPKKITDIGQEVIYERIPQFRLQCLQQADQLILEAAEHHDNKALEQYYITTLRPFLSKAPNCLVQFFSSNRGSQFIVTEIDNLKRYLNDDEKAVAQQLQQIVNTRADLDNHYAYQHILKSWLFCHIPLTFSLLVLLAVHLVLVYAF